MSSKNDSEVPGKTKRGVSRRGFIRGAGIGGGVLGAGLLDKKALAAPAAGGQFVGPGAVPITLKINGKPQTLNLEPRVTLLDALRNRSGPDRRQARVRPGHLRRLHRHPQRQIRV